MMMICTNQSDELIKLNKKVREAKLKLKALELEFEILEIYSIDGYDDLKEELHRLQLIMPRSTVKLVNVKNDRYNSFYEILPTRESKIKILKFVNDVELLYEKRVGYLGIVASYV